MVISLAAVFLALASYTDITSYKIPNRLNLAFALTMLSVGLLLGPENFPRALAAGAASFAIFLVLHLAHPSGLGMGDVKLAFGLGFCLGWFSLAAVGAGFFTALLINAFGALTLLLLSALSAFFALFSDPAPFSEKEKSPPAPKALPFAPALGAGSLAGLAFIL